MPYFVWMIDSDGVRERFASLSPHLDERGRRLFAATEANSAGYGGIAAVSRSTGIAPSTIGREKLVQADPALFEHWRIGMIGAFA